MKVGSPFLAYLLEEKCSFTAGFESCGVMGYLVGTVILCLPGESLELTEVTKWIHHRAKRGREDELSGHH